MTMKQLMEIGGKNEQTGTGLSRRHISGSKAAKGIQYVKVLVSWRSFYEKVVWKNVSQCRNKLKGRTLWGFSISILSQNSKRIELGFSSLGQMVQFCAIILYRTFVELFWSLQVYRKQNIEKH